MSFGPPKRKPKLQSQPVPLAPPRPVIVAPRPVVVAPPPPPSAPKPQPPRTTRPAPAEAVNRSIKVLRPQLEPRGQQVSSFPTWKPLPAPVVRLPAHPVEAVEAATRSLPVPALHALRLLSALLLLAPLGWLVGWFGLPATSADFLMTGIGRLAWRGLGGPDAMLLYWVLLFPVALALSYVGRLAWPLLGLGVFYWSWEGLHHLLGMPAPWTPW